MFIFMCIRKKSLHTIVKLAQSCPTLCDPMACSLPCSSVCGILQARILEWVAISFSRRSSEPRSRTRVSRIVGRCFTIWATRKALHQTSGISGILTGFSRKLPKMKARVCLEEGIGLIFGGRKGDISIRSRLHLAEECPTWHILPLLVLSVDPERAHMAALWGHNRPPSHPQAGTGHRSEPGQNWLPQGWPE